MLNTQHSVTVAPSVQVQSGEFTQPAFSRPGETPEQTAWILEYATSSDPFANFIVASRYRAVHRHWPGDQKPSRPSFEGVSVHRREWIKRQCKPESFEVFKRRKAGKKPSEVFAGQREWLEAYHARAARNDARQMNHHNAQQIADLTIERDQIQQWFRENSAETNDEAWREQFLKLRQIESMLKTLEELPHEPPEDVRFSITSLGQLMLNRKARAAA